MAVILIIETSTEVCSVALSIDGMLVDLIETKEGQNHARLVGVFTEQLLTRNHMSRKELSAVVVSKGPGSYTGLRIGVSTAKGICFALQIPLIAIGTLEAMTHHVMVNREFYQIGDAKSTLFCPMIDARRMEVYSMLIQENGEVLKPITAVVIDENFLAEELKTHQVVFFGNGAEKFKQALHSANTIFIPEIDASAKYMNDLSWQSYNKNTFENVAYFEPFYLKDFVATTPRKKML